MKYFLLLLIFLSCGRHTSSLAPPPGENIGVAQDPEVVPRTIEEIEDEYDPATNLNLVIAVPENLPEGFIDYSNNCEEANGEKEFRYYTKKIQDLGGKSVNPFANKAYTEDLLGFDKYLDDSGIKHFSAKEVAQSGRTSILKQCKIENLLPPKACWVRSTVLLLMAEKIRAHLGRPLSVTSHFRSSCYNKGLYKALDKEEVNSDHLLARAIDLSVTGTQVEKVEVRKKIQTYLCDEFWFDRYFNSIFSYYPYESNVSAGFGTTQIHLGLDSPKGKRSWSYNGDSILKDSDSRKCFYDDKIILPN